MTTEFDELHPPGENVFQSAPGQLAHLAAANAQSIAQHIQTNDEKVYDPISGKVVLKSRSAFEHMVENERAREATEGDTGYGYNSNLNIQDAEGYEKPKLLPPGLATQPALDINNSLDTEDMAEQGFVAFQKRKKFDNIYQEKADRVRRLHAPRFGKYYKDPDRPIHASEIKSWFHAWLGKQHLSANYDYQSSMSLNSKGGQDHMFTVECTVTGFKHTARARMETKKECQTAATWLMIDWMILNNHIDPRLIPFEKEDIYVDVKHVNLEGDENENQRTIYTKKMRFVKAGKLSTDGSEQLEDDDSKKRRIWEHSAPSEVERAQKTVEMIFGGKSKPIGMEYMEFLQGSGKNRWHCRLCDTEVTDEAGKAMHVRGRKHKLNYKRFVDPDLGVGKLSAEEERILKSDVLEYQKTLAAEHKTKAAELENVDAELLHHENLEDFLGSVYEDYYPDEREEYKKLDKVVEFKCPSLKHVYAHACTLPMTDNEKLVCKKLAMIREESATVMVAKMVSQIQEFENALVEILKVIDAENPNQAWIRWPKPIARIGTYPKSIVRPEDKETAVQFVVHCERHPTRELVLGVVEKCRIKLDPRESEVVVKDVFPSYFSVAYGGSKKMSLPVYFTSTRLFNQVSIIPKYYGTPLSRDSCIKLLMDVKRKDFYLKEMKRIPGYVDTLRLMRDIANRSKAWAEIKGWPLEIIVRNALAGSINCSLWPTKNGKVCYDGIPMQPQPMNNHTNLKRVFEYIGSGALDLYGLLDPVELVKIDRQVLKKLVGYDEDDVITLEAGPEMPSISEDSKNLKAMFDMEKLRNKQVKDAEKEEKKAEQQEIIRQVRKEGEEGDWSDGENKNTVEEELKPRARKRERKSKFGKKAESYQVAPVSTVKIVKQGDVEVSIADDNAETNNDQDSSATENKRPKMMQFVKAGQTVVTSGLENMEKDETVTDVQEVIEETKTQSGVTKKNFDAISKPLDEALTTNDQIGTDGLKSSGMHIDLISSLLGIDKISAKQNAVSLSLYRIPFLLTPLPMTSAY